jgi:hypothetical protein
MFVDPVKRSVVMPSRLDQALVELAAAQNRDANAYVVQVLEDHAVSVGALAPEHGGEVAAFWSLVDRVCDSAKELCRQGAFVPEITLKAIQHRIESDPDWVADYRRHVGDDIYKTGNPRKGPINREIGSRVKKAIGATIREDEPGKPAKLKVLGSIVQSVTLMESFDPDAVKV